MTNGVSWLRVVSVRVRTPFGERLLKLWNVTYRLLVILLFYTLSLRYSTKVSVLVYFTFYGLLQDADGDSGFLTADSKVINEH